MAEFDEYTADSDVANRETSKEWASSFTVDGVQYATSIFWESLQNVDTPFVDAKEASENVLVGADLFCVKQGKSPQLGLASSAQGFKKGMAVAAVTAVTAMSESSSLLAVFKVDAGYWYLCIRNDIILSDGDVLFVKEEDAKEQFLSMLSVPDWSKKIAPVEWGIDDTEQRDIAEVFAQGLTTKLEKINALRGFELFVVVALSLAIGGWLIVYLSNILFEPKVQETRVITQRAQKKVTKQVEHVVLEPWEALIDPISVMDNCRKAIHDLTTLPTPGWRNLGVTCTPLEAVTSWSKDFGRLSWIELSLHHSGLNFSSKTIDKDSSKIIVSVPFNEPKKIKSAPSYTEGELRHMINDLFQAINLRIDLSSGTISSEGKNYNVMKFILKSTYEPNIWKEMLTKFSGLTVNNIHYNNNIWNYEGTIYVK